ncbi:MAG: hypothetical protein M3R06_03375 [Chloroflexota bacterium]|nr:hypothetical protein [Chloroflexota bacterium]
MDLDTDAGTFDPASVSRPTRSRLKSPSGVALSDAAHAEFSPDSYPAVAVDYLAGRLAPVDRPPVG